MSRLIVVANRLPIKITRRSDGIRFSPSPGGLATGLSAIPKSFKQIWIGWPGITKRKCKPEEREEISEALERQDCRPVFLSEEQIKQYYRGFSNRTIWPLFHYFPLHTVYEPRFWKTYKQVNHIFCEEVMKVARPGDRIWVHDYQLMLLPQLLREKLSEPQIGFFLHIPFPSFELFRLLPWREELLNGILGADLIGFHTYEYVRHFLSSVCRIVGIEHTLGKLGVGERVVSVDAFPLGIDYEKYSKGAERPEAKKEVNKIRKKVGNRKIIISIDRLDYTKGILQRLEAFDLFLTENPEYKGKVTLIMVAVPSRTNVQDYMILREELEQLVGRVSGEHGSLGWMPVWYLYRSLAFEQLVALYHLADVALVTPLRDGMNLISKEFIAAKKDGKGVLILSEMAGASSELGEALIVNANNKREIIKAIKQSLEMPVEEQVERNRAMQSRLSRYNVFRWAGEFMDSISEVHKIQQELSVRKLTKTESTRLVNSFKKANRRLLLFDYDGTLVEFKKRPGKAHPEHKVFGLLENLGRDPKNEMVIISGRDKETLTNWLGGLDVTLVAEHGAWVKKKGEQWQCIEPFEHDWKEAIRPILELYTDRTPGSLIEEKDFALVWHYRRSEPEQAYVRTQELRDALTNLTGNLDVGVFEGNKILEIRNLGINKGRAAKIFIEEDSWDFILAAGDDYTDEDMFAALPEAAYSIKVGGGISKARFNVEGTKQIRYLIERLTGE